MRSLTLKKTPETAWKIPFSAGELGGIFSAMLEIAGLPQCYVELTLLDDSSMSELHTRSLDCRGPTNILSFPAPPSAIQTPEAETVEGGKNNNAFDEPRLLGWLALSVDTLLRECYLYGQEVDEHCLRLLAHGFAHLLGYDHGMPMEALCASLEDAARKKLHSL
jgi:metalloprotein, YbeY/UPF0054 family